MFDDKINMRLPKGMEDEYFYFYIGVIEEFGICIPLTLLEFDILNIVNVSLS